MIPTTIVSEIEKSIFALPTNEQRMLITRVSRALRQQDDEEIDHDLLAMANDPDIRREIEEIDREFRVTEMDGLGK